MITDADLAARVRALAADRVDPLSVGCVVCSVGPRTACFATTASPVLDEGAHHFRRTDARLTAEGAAIRLLVELASATD